MSSIQQYQELLKLLRIESPCTISTLRDIQGRLYSAQQSHLITGKGIVANGTCLGIKGKQFKPSSHLLQLFGKTCTRKTVVNEKGEFLVTCGRDAWKENITVTTCSDGDYTLILNSHSEVIGLGWYRNRKVETMYDIGDYLRREKFTKRRRK